MEIKLSRDDLLRQKRDRGTVSFHKFVLKYKNNKNKSYCFVEGEDSKYYMPRLLMICKTEPEFIRCNGKKAVIEAYKEIQKHKEYRVANLLFFVDSDFDNPLNNEMIYETPCYSIENLYTSPLVLERILKSEFNLDESEEDFHNAMNLFLKRRNEYHNSIALLNAWILSYKKYIDNTGENIKLRLNELSFKEDLIDVSLEGITCKYNLKDIEKMLNVPNKISDSDILNIYNKIRESPHRGKIFRGKFELEFFKLFLVKLIEDINKKESRKVFQIRGKVRLNLDTNILTILSSYAETPESLFEYIQRRIRKPPTKYTTSTA